MPRSYDLTALVTATLALSGAARAQPLESPGSNVLIHKVVVHNTYSQTVKYYVTGGSPRLQALVRHVEWAENELGVIEQMQQLKLETVVNERRVAAYRTAQLTNPLIPPGFTPYPVAPRRPGDGKSALQKSLTAQLAYAALQMIEYLERAQTDLDAERKALSSPEQKAAQGPIDSLRPRLAALPRAERPPQTQPAASAWPSARSRS